MSIHVFKQLYYTLIYPYWNYAVVVWGNTYSSNLNKLSSLSIIAFVVCFLLIVESNSTFSISFLIFLNLIILLNWVRAYSHIRYWTSIPVFLSCFMILSGQFLACTSITPDTPPRVFHQPKVRFNTVKFTFVYVASKFWETVPTNWKRLSINDFKKRYKNHALKYQSQFWIPD